MSTSTVAAIDLGASTGRVMLGHVGPETLELTEVHRFPNTPIEINGTLHWDILRLFRGVIDGLRKAAHAEPASIGVDAWAVDYGLLDSDGQLLGYPVHYRDTRTDGIMSTVLQQIDVNELYATTGLQQLPFNTIYQLVAEAQAGTLDQAETLLLIPDLITYWLTGQFGAERTNASTTQLYDVHDQRWDIGLIRRLDLPEKIFPTIHDPGSSAGTILPEVANDTGLAPETIVTRVASHDTASAVAAVPARSERFAYISCGTWSLVGLELDQPVLTEASRLANFTNETGLDGRIRYLRNVMGLWLLQESIRAWQRAGQPADLGALLRHATHAQPLARVIDPNDPAFLPPGNIPARIATACRLSGQTPPRTQAETVRCILDSLALAYRRAVRQAQELSDHNVDAVHIVGGGANNRMLCQLTANACGLPIIAGPVEATAIGNVLVQARKLGAIDGDISDLRSLVAHTHTVVHYEPTSATYAYAEVEHQVSSNEAPQIPDVSATPRTCH